MPPPAASSASGPPPAGATPLGSRLAEMVDVTPLRRDRSATLAGEPAGRINRLDVLLVLLVFLSTLTLRGYRVEEPHEMYFDEVYHARTAIEFLQHWRYDMPHSIYEYTHPHLAKYLMALGIETLGNNRVTGRRDLGLPVAGAAIERRWNQPGDPTGRNGDRLYVVSGAELRVYDLASGDLLLAELAGFSAVSVDDVAHVLYGAAPDGTIRQFSTTVIDAWRSAAADDLGMTFDVVARVADLDGEVSRLVVAGDRLLVGSTGGTLVSLDLATGQEVGRTVLPDTTVPVPLNVEGEPAVALGTPAGIALLGASDLEQRHFFATDAPVTGLAVALSGADPPAIYAAAGDGLQMVVLARDEPPRAGSRVAMPNQVNDVLWNPGTTYVHAVGTTQDGAAPTIYIVEPRSNAVFADARLTFEPALTLVDAQPDRPAEDRQDLIVLGRDGELALIDAGSNGFAYRLPGVLVAALMAACIYLLARFLFARRSVALIASALVLAEGMLFSNARIAMNDSYVAFFIVAALTLFVPLWLGRWRRPAAIVGGLVGVGVLLGLALASKWVGAYAIGAVALLILLRSALGRLLTLLTMIGLTAVLGYMAIAPPPNEPEPQLNFVFLALMVLLTVALAAGMVLRPLHWSPDERRLLYAGPVVPGVAGMLAGLLLESRAALVVGGLLVLAGPLLYAADRLRRRSGPPVPVAGAPAVRAGDPPRRGWLRPGSGPLGLPWLLALGAITVLPLAIYALSYLPWIELGNRWTADFPAGHTGQTFLELQRSMYDYHQYLRATHAAASPWWAWPIDLKPVWFEQGDYANGLTGVIYNTGNIVIFWLALPAVAFVAWQAWRRRSLALAVLVVAIACLWLPWARIDRATFQYHFLTSVPFTILALAYFLGELWHGPSRRTWLLARLAAAIAIIGPAALWLLRLPLCGLARTEQVNPGTEVCAGLSRQLVLTDLQAVGLLLVIGGLVGAGLLLQRPHLGGNRRLLVPGAVSV
ncbi:MAG TPA: phospholipid carrier-dependent glycosyltransferase, partial [Candidatus Limnocylindria bacterium]|nr:phospholipid carrier-dependent glycosyltransferase [Candidatus Limnocylindria bacterium]